MEKMLYENSVFSPVDVCLELNFSAAYKEVSSCVVLFSLIECVDR